MNLADAIRKAERVLPGEEAPEGELDPRWQAIIDVSDHLQQHPNQVWRFTRKWGAHSNADLRTAVATCLLEHLLEHHFDRIFPLTAEACGQSMRFADTFSRCGEFGQTEQSGNLERFRKLQEQIRRNSANQAVQREPAVQLIREIESHRRLAPVADLLRWTGTPCVQ